jgi:hypothetical protein
MVTQSGAQAWTEGLKGVFGTNCAAVCASRAHGAPVGTGEQRTQLKSRL